MFLGENCHAFLNMAGPARFSAQNIYAEHRFPVMSSMAERESFSDGEASEDLPDSPGRARSQHSLDSAESAIVNSSELESLELQRVIPKVAKSIAGMEVTNPEILRVTRAFSAFQNLAVALRVECDGDFYYKSWKSEKISTFWSHSWHGGQWKKILTLLTFYNGPAAMFFAFVIATFMMILFASRDLPSLDRGLWDVKFSVWCLPCGFVVATMIMLLWRSQTKVFLEPQTLDISQVARFFLFPRVDSIDFNQKTWWFQLCKDIFSPDFIKKRAFKGTVMDPTTLFRILHMKKWAPIPFTGSSWFSWFSDK